jgi:2-polyprenyl-3-methyl-5-hydroxy-6-metoxy-1,4-benzoquinol methylase
MAVYRTKGDQNFKNYGKTAIETVSPMEWADEMEVSRIDEDSWVQRYKYEAEIISQICIENGYKKILELGSGPGLLSQYIMQKVKDANYSFVDKETSKAIFEKRGFKGNKFYVKDLMHIFDISDLDRDYDLIIANDFLEHIANPSHVMYQCREITKERSGFFISVPNWRMNHEFIYRGLFDYDNFVYFCRIHGWNPSEIAGSILKCEHRPKLSSEESLPDDLIDSWNWYFYCEKLS